ncbi:ALDH-like protein, partial [Coprinellus micaceus]
SVSPPTTSLSHTPTSTPSSPPPAKLLPRSSPTAPALDSTDYGRIVSQLHFQRITHLLEKTKGTVEVGGAKGPGGAEAKDRGIEPTIVKVKEGDVLLEEELFAPVLPVLGVESLDEALAYVRKRDHPLVIYAFSEDKATQDKIRKSTMSGGLVFNDTFQQLSVNEIPFGGVGESGYGRQVLKYTFEEFTYQRTVVDIPQSEEPKNALRYPPSSKESLALFEGWLRVPIEEPPASTNGKANL